MPGNRQIIVRGRPTCIPQAEHFELVDGNMPFAGAGEILIRNLFLSVDPAMRGWLADTSNYSQPIAIGSVMRSLAVGEVVESNAPAFAAGERVMGWFGWQQFAATTPDAVIRKVEDRDLSPSLALGVLGLNGVTALLGLEKVARPTAGDTVVVSTAAGAVGSAVGQIAKLLGCRTVGITGGAEKLAICRDEFGYDVAIDYQAPGLDQALANVCPQGANVYFDNTAGPISDTVYRNLALHARVVTCGTASVSSWNPVPTGPRIERIVMTRRAQIGGFVVLDYMDEFQPAGARLAQWVREGKLKYREEIVDGIENCPGAIADLYEGRNLGKRLIRLV
ncbi:NADP-dependent oxidoreductase [Sphingomonas nostoxanthinifaciens]|uniref:NADP-dependent oxidoreductase n=1 Tax=Sphingomonas nostoxanthinifaciens TaxID=2872652 RepID=UPI001CC21587|nr:NADP-dependent oxidoreductase [Sphingomonas nostoxanthinifaciens]UAK25291.1 NADP-dependent oxidoreductase [Sphingomonas nostoxanthinifaciens]